MTEIKIKIKNKSSPHTVTFILDRTHFQVFDLTIFFVALSVVNLPVFSHISLSPN